jgi:hypothetical protein
MVHSASGAALLPSILFWCCLVRVYRASLFVILGATLARCGTLSQGKRPKNPLITDI